MKKNCTAECATPDGRAIIANPLQGTFPALGLLLRGSTLAQLPRLLLEGLAPARRMFIQGFNNSELARLVRNHTPVTFVCSYARSGNTWMRYLLSDIRLQNEGLETSTNHASRPRLCPITTRI